MKRFIVVTCIAWAVIITVLHAWLNLDISWLRFGADGASETKFRIGFLPVT